MQTSFWLLLEILTPWLLKSQNLLNMQNLGSGSSCSKGLSTGQITVQIYSVVCFVTTYPTTGGQVYNFLTCTVISPQMKWGCVLNKERPGRCFSSEFHRLVANSSNLDQNMHLNSKNNKVWWKMHYSETIAILLKEQDSLVLSTGLIMWIGHRKKRFKSWCFKCSLLSGFAPMKG